MIQQLFVRPPRRSIIRLWTVIVSAVSIVMSIALAATIVRWGWLSLAIAASICFMAVTLLNPYMLAIGLVFSVALSPELPLGLPLRVEDFVLLWGVIVLLMRLATHQTSWPTVLNWQLWLVLLTVEVIATLIGVTQGTARLDLTVYSGLIFLAKNIETFALYVVAIWLLDTRAKIQWFIWILLLGGASLGMYGMVAQLTGSTPPAIIGSDYAPVVDIEGGSSYSLIATALIPPLALGVSLWLTGGRQIRRASTWLLAPIVYSITFSLSRQGYVGTIAALCTILWTRSRRLFILVISLFLLILSLFPAAIPEPVRERVSPMFDPITGEDMGMTVYRTRINVWRYRFPEMWRTNPITGRGLASLPPGYLDNQYLVALYYSGFLGLGAFLLLLGSFGKRAWQLYISNSTFMGQTLGLAGLGAVFGLGIAGLGGSPFVAVRAREMFWLLMACMAAYSAQMSGEEDGKPVD